MLQEMVSRGGLNPSVAYYTDHFQVSTITYTIDPKKEYVIFAYCWSSNQPYGTADLRISKGQLLTLRNGVASGRAYFNLNDTTFSMQVTSNMHGMCHIIQLD